MATPDRNIEEFGQEVTHIWVSNAQFQSYDGADDQSFEGGFDPDSSTIQNDTVKAIVSNPSERISREFEGIVEDGSKTLSVKSDVTVKADREGRPDRFDIEGVKYKVAEVVSDSHAFYPDQIKKQTVILNRLDR